MFLLKYVINFLFLFLLMPGLVQAHNFPDRKAVLLDLKAPIELSDFTFKNDHLGSDIRSGRRFIQELAWTNIASQPVIAFEVMILAYDPFNRAMPSSRWMVAGTNSVKWEPLEPGQSGTDGIVGSSTKKVFTAIAYVNMVRYADGTIWAVDSENLLKKLNEVLPSIKSIEEVEED